MMNQIEGKAGKKTSSEMWCSDTSMEDEDSSFISNTDATICNTADLCSSRGYSMISDPNIETSSSSMSHGDYLIASSRLFNNNKQSQQQEIRIFNVVFAQFSDKDNHKEKGSESSKRLPWTWLDHVVELLGGPERATPRSILELMDVKDLTLAQVENYLQDCRFRLAQPPQQQHGGHWKSLSQVSPDLQEHGSTSDRARNSPSESASSLLSGALMSKKLKEEIGKVYANHSVVGHESYLDELSLRDIAGERVDIVAERMHNLPYEFLEKLKHELRVILGGTGSFQHWHELKSLQWIVNSRGDLMDKALSVAHPTQLEILVTIKTEIQSFLHPTVSLSQATLIDTFLYRRCRNTACANVLPAAECTCGICSKKNGFCNLCMCMICNKFDFKVNTCGWVVCDSCSHWSHTDCAISNWHIGTGTSGDRSTETLFRCVGCSRTSELLGWAKDVFQHCAPNWDAHDFVRELNYVRRIFQRSEDSRGRKIFQKCEYLIEEMKGRGSSVSFLQDKLHVSTDFLFS